jgi:hypothetical protein
MTKKIVVAVLIGILVGIAASKFYMIALRAGHTASFLPDYIVGVVVGCLAAVVSLIFIRR